MKIILNREKIEQIILRYITDILKVNLEPIENGRYLEYREPNGDLLMEIDTLFPNSVDCKIRYDFYIKMFKVLSIEALDYHDILNSVITKITGFKIDNIIPSLKYDY